MELGLGTTLKHKGKEATVLIQNESHVFVESDDGVCYTIPKAEIKDSDIINVLEFCKVCGHELKDAICDNCIKE